MNVLYTKTFLKDLKKLKNNHIALNAIKNKIEEFERLSIEDIKSNSKMLKNSDKYYRYRVGKYRIIYTITEEDKIFIILLNVGKRDTIYRNY